MVQAQLNKKYLTFLIILCTITAILLVTNIKTAGTVTKNHAAIPSTTPPKSEATLFFIPDTIFTQENKSQQVDIYIDSVGAKPTLVQIELAYDPLTISDIALSPGSFFHEPDILINNIDRVNGRISYALSLRDDLQQMTDKGIIARLQFTTDKNTSVNPASIYFLPKTSIRQKSNNIDLKAAYGLKILNKSRESPTSIPKN